MVEMKVTKTIVSGSKSGRGAQIAGISQERDGPKRKVGGEMSLRWRREKGRWEGRGKGAGAR